MFNENQIYDNYISGITKIGRTTMLLGMVATLAPALLMTFYFGYNPGYLQSLQEQSVKSLFLELSGSVNLSVIIL